MATSRKRAAPRADIPDPFAAPPAQKEIAIEPASVAPTDEARTALTTIGTQLVEFDAVEAGIEELERKYKGVVFAVDTAKGMREACDARATINKPIHATEHARKAAKAPLLDLGRYIDGRARKIDGRLRALAAPVDDQIKVEERREATRKADIERQLQDLRGTPTQCIGKSSAQLQEVLDAVTALPLEPFDEFRPQAAAAQESVRQQITQMLRQSKLAEEAEALRRQQEQELARRTGLQRQVDDIAAPLSLAYRTSERVQQAIDRLAALQIGEHFAEFAPAAREKKAEVLAKLTELRDEKKRVEDAAAAAVPAPTPAPTAAPTAAPAERYVSSAPLVSTRVDPVMTPQATGTLDTLAGHATVACQGCGKATTALGMRRCPECQQAAHDRINNEGAQRLHEALTQPDFDVVDAEVNQRPSDAEILGVVASHYDVTWSEAARWLRAMDFGAIDEHAAASA